MLTFYYLQNLMHNDGCHGISTSLQKKTLFFGQLHAFVTRIATVD